MRKFPFRDNVPKLDLTKPFTEAVVTDELNLIPCMAIAVGVAKKADAVHVLMFADKDHALFMDAETFFSFAEKIRAAYERERSTN